MNEGECLRLLIVDDDPSFLREMTPRLRRFLGECEITTALNGMQAVDLVAAQPDGFDVALIDQVLDPPPDGIEVMQVLREAIPYIPVIIMTGWGLGGGLEALRAGAYRYIAKGFSVEELAYMVRAAAEHQRLMRQSWLGRVLTTSNALQSRMAVEEVLDTILSGIRDMGFDRVRLYLLSDDGERLVGRMQQGGERDIVGLELPLAEDECSRETLESRRPRIYSSAPGRRMLYVDVLEKDDVGEWADIPLIARGRPIGKISADNKYSRRRLLEAELEPLMVLANQAANAIHNARNYEKTQAALANLERIYQASGRIAAIVDLDETLNLIITNAVEATRAAAASLSLIDAAGNEERRATVNFTPAMRKMTAVRPDGYSRQVVTSRRHIAMPDVAAIPNVNPGILKCGFRANICLPLLVGDRAIGVMWVNYTEPRAFPDDEVALLQTFANQAAVAIEHARLHAETRRQLVHLDALNRVGQILVGSLELDRTPRVLIQEVTRLLNLEAGSVLLVEGDELVVHAAVGPLAERVQGCRFPRDRGIAGRAVRTAQPQLVPDVKGDPDFFPGVDAASGFVSRSLLAVPLEAQGRIIGVIEAVNKRDGDFGPLDVQLLTSLAPAASSALANARLYAEAQACSLNLEQHARKLSAVQRVCAEISSLLSREKIAELVCRRLVELFQVDHSGFVLFDPDGRFGTVIGEYPARNLVGDRIPLRGIPLEEEIITARQPCAIEAVAADTRLGSLRGRLLEAGIRSLLIVPLVVGERVIGSFSLDAIDRGMQFAQETIDLCQIIAAQAALAIENARLFDEEQTRARRWQRVANAATEITQALSRSPRQLLDIIARAATDIVGADCAVIYPYDARTRRFDLANVASYGLREPNFPVKDKERGGGWVSRILREGLVRVNDLEQEEPEIAPQMRMFRDEGVRAFVGVRLGTTPEPVGVLYVNFRQAHHWSDDEVEAIQPYVAQAAVAIKHAVFQGQLLERTRKDQQRLATVIALSRQFGSSLDINQVVDSLLQSLGAPFPQAHSRTVALYDVTSGELAIHPAAYRYYWDERRAARLRYPVPSGRSICGWVATQRMAANVPDVRKDPRTYRLASETRSQLTVPIEFADQLIGVLTLESRDVGAFSDEDVQLLAALADQAGVAIHNARTFERLREAEMSLRTRTAMLWTSKAGFIWFHRIRGAAGAIRDWVLLARDKLGECGQLDVVATELKEIEEEAADIVTRVPSRMMLSGEERPTQVRVNDLLRRTVGETCEHHGDVKVQLVWRLRLTDTATVMADERWLAEALGIVITNALREMADGGGRLTITSSARRGRVEIRIGDTGHGIPATVRRKLFREPVGPADGGKGSGQGLLWTKTILEGYGGDIGVEKTGARGTTFLITLPEWCEGTLSQPNVGRSV
jgi:GAF domain-containing protein/CheY-like chemotaxis protein